jgi:hypothetical protein
MEAAGLSENLRTLRSMIGEAERGDHSEAEGLSVLLGLMMGEAKVGGDPSEAGD